MLSKPTNLKSRTSLKSIATMPHKETNCAFRWRKKSPNSKDDLRSIAKHAHSVAAKRVHADHTILSDLFFFFFFFNLPKLSQFDWKQFDLVSQPSMGLPIGVNRKRWILCENDRDRICTFQKLNACVSDGFFFFFFLANAKKMILWEKKMATQETVTKNVLKNCWDSKREMHFNCLSDSWPLIIVWLSIRLIACDVENEKLDNQNPSKRILNQTNLIIWSLRSSDHFWKVNKKSRILVWKKANTGKEMERNVQETHA